MRPYKFHQLSRKAQKHCIEMQKKFNFKKLSESQIIEKIKDWDFNSKGEFYNHLIN